ncbi:LysE family translocator [Thalassotalea ponticola]|uniref:LysE family translocator n=1 Tax=Thalassotalea ponticola TaxID=1523392 RepID=UPI0025B33EC7|nr:LysE family translocator [Thalassotalea ponticola]MDN3652004.1 LysE family translocator [Thalassotalea ponticola]
MAVDAWLSLVVICLLGAISPGPSLALVMRNTMSSGRSAGVKTAIAHGLGVGLYAAIALTGIGLILVNSSVLFQVIQYLGAMFLIWLAYQTLTNSDATIDVEHSAKPSLSAWRDGFLLAFLNPKLAIFFIALFSQFIDANASLNKNLIMVMTVSGIDMAWYSIVAWGLSQQSILPRLQQHSKWLERLMATVLVLLAIRVVW